MKKITEENYNILNNNGYSCYIKKIADEFFIIKPEIGPLLLLNNTQMSNDLLDYFKKELENNMFERYSTQYMIFEMFFVNSKNLDNILSIFIDSLKNYDQQQQNYFFNKIMRALEKREIFIKSIDVNCFLLKKYLNHDAETINYFLDFIIKNYNEKMCNFIFYNIDENKNKYNKIKDKILFLKKQYILKEVQNINEKFDNLDNSKFSNNNFKKVNKI